MVGDDCRNGSWLVFDAATPAQELGLFGGRPHGRATDAGGVFLIPTLRKSYLISSGLAPRAVLGIGTES